MPYSDHSGLRIYYEVAGEGPAMVLVHANPFDHRLWLYQVARFSPHFRIIAVDLRGYGRSGKPETPFSLADMAEDVVGVCRAERIEQAIFCGVSVGSGIAMLISLEHPELVSALVLVGGSASGAPGMQKRVEGFLSGNVPAYHRQHLKECVTARFAATETGASLLDLFNSGAERLSGRCIAQIFRARLACDLRPRLRSIAAPTLVINGEHDPSLAAGRETASLIPGATHDVLPGTGHACNFEDPGRFNSRVTEFLRMRGLFPTELEPARHP